jgi:hypothetical protein
VFLVAGFLLSQLPGFQDSAWILIPSVVIGIVAAFFLDKRMEKVRLAKRKETCASPDQAAFLTSIGGAPGKQGYVITEETFGFVREEYARMFKEQNPGLILPF